MTLTACSSSCCCCCAGFQTLHHSQTKRRSVGYFCQQRQRRCASLEIPAQYTVGLQLKNSSDSWYFRLVFENNIVTQKRRQCRINNSSNCEQCMTSLFANHGNTPRDQRTVFTRSASTPPKVNRFGLNLEKCEPNVGGLAVTDFGSDLCSSDS